MTKETTYSEITRKHTKEFANWLAQDIAEWLEGDYPAVTTPHKGTFILTDIDKIRYTISVHKVMQDKTTRRDLLQEKDEEIVRLRDEVDRLTMEAQGGDEIMDADEVQ